MLFTLVGEYLQNLLYCWANSIAIHAGNDAIYPVLGVKLLKLASYIYSRDTTHWGTTLFDDSCTSEISMLSEEQQHQFNSLIRTIAYRAQVVKLDGAAFEFAKILYWGRVRQILKEVIFVTPYLDGFVSDARGNKKRKIAYYIADAFHVSPGWKLSKSKNDGSTFVVSFMPVPELLETANHHLESIPVHRKVYGVEGTTLEVENLLDEGECQCECQCECEGEGDCECEDLDLDL